jgi:hypothetical protein
MEMIEEVGDKLGAGRSPGVRMNYGTIKSSKRFPTSLWRVSLISRTPFKG